MSAVHAVAPLDFYDLDPGLQAALLPRYERLGYLGDFFRCMGHQPRALEAFDRFTQACREALAVPLCEAVALTTACATGNVYERNQHERLAVRSGLTPDWVAAVERLVPDDDGTSLGEVERAAQRFVLAVVRARGPGRDELADLARRTDDATAAAVALLTARFVGHAIVCAASGAQPPVPSIFEDGFAGGAR